MCAFSASMGRVKAVSRSDSALAGLADMWESNSDFRRKVMQRKSLLEWPSESQVGVMSYESLGKNIDLLLPAIRIYCSRFPAKSPCIADLKDEATVCSFPVTVLCSLTTMP